MLVPSSALAQTFCTPFCSKSPGRKTRWKEPGRGLCCLGFHLMTASPAHEVALSADTKPSLPRSLLQLNGCIVNL